MKKSISTIVAVAALVFSATEIQANSEKATATSIEIIASTQLQPVYDAYFTVKDALIKSDGKLTSAKAKNLLTAIAAVKIDKLK